MNSSTEGETKRVRLSPAATAARTRVLDMVRTTINITGDCAITMIVDRTEGTLDESIYYSKQ